MAEIDLKGLADEDATPSRESTLARLLKMRKWMVGAGLLLALLHYRWWNEAAFRHAVGLDSLPPYAIHFGVSVFAVYLLFQGVAALIQFLMFEDSERLDRLKAELKLLEVTYEGKRRDTRQHMLVASDRHRKKPGADKAREPQHRILKIRLLAIRAGHGLQSGLLRTSETFIDWIRVAPCFLLLIIAVFTWTNFTSPFFDQSAGVVQPAVKGVTPAR